MNSLITLVRYEIWVFLLGLMSAVAYQILTGKINIKGLLVEKNGSSNYSKIRVQLLFFTLIGSFYYVRHVMNNPNEFPIVPNELLLAIGGSNMVYLGGKSYSLLFKRK